MCLPSKSKASGEPFSSRRSTLSISTSASQNDSPVTAVTKSMASSASPSRKSGLSPNPSPSGLSPHHFLHSNKNKTFKPRKNISESSRQYTLFKYVEKTLQTGNLREAVKLPKGEDVHEWLAVNTVDFYNQVNLLYGSITEYCTPVSCSVMNAGPRFEYHWCDGVKFPKPVEVSAPVYVDYLMTWIQGQLDDERIFPSKIGVPFPPDFRSVILPRIFKRLFRVYAHIYLTHFSKIVDLREEAHINTSFRHFYFFVKEFSLVEGKEFSPLSELIAKIESSA